MDRRQHRRSGKPDRNSCRGKRWRGSRKRAPGSCYSREAAPIHLRTPPSREPRQRHRSATHVVVSHHPPKFPFYYGINACNGLGVASPRADYLAISCVSSVRTASKFAKELAVEKPGEFDGPTITVPRHDREA